jgi:beta-xylosidase
MGSAENISGNGGIGTSTFVSRRQDAVEFTAEVTLEFYPDLSNSVVEDEEAGMTLFIQRQQHFDLGVVVQQDSTGLLKKFIRLRTFSANSSADGMTNAYSQPGILALGDDANRLRMRVQAVNTSTYTFSYVDLAKPGDRITVGYGAAKEVSGGFTGVSIASYSSNIS